MMTSLIQTARVRSHFDRVSRDWGARYENPPRKMSDLDLQLRLDNCVDLLQPIIHSSARQPMRLVDIGCGTGDLLLRLGHESLSAVGVDLAPQMLAAARNRCRGAHFMAADAGRLPIASGSADVVTCLGVLEYLPDPTAALTEIRRVLAPGGHLLVSLPNRASLFRKLSRIEVSLENTAFAVIHALRRARRNHEPAPYSHRQWTLAQASALLATGHLEMREVRFQTYGTWGRLGRLPVFLALSRRLSQRLRGESALSRRLAYTMLVHARAT